jgi:hypothetical protein
MREKPILMSTPMVQAILEGRKTQTRRALNPQPIDILPMNVSDEWVALTEINPNHGKVVKCRFGQIGDRLWVRETFKYGAIDIGGDFKAQDIWIYYKADGREFKPIKGKIGKYPHSGWKPSIFMPRWASRITLEITDIKVQRLWEITEEDCVAEGLKLLQGGIVSEYAVLWNKINGKKHHWKDNPWVWVIEFKRIV